MNETEMREVLTRIQGVLFLDSTGEVPQWNPTKTWDLRTVTLLMEKLEEAGLVPEETIPVPENTVLRQGPPPTWKVILATNVSAYQTQFVQAYVVDDAERLALNRHYNHSWEVDDTPLVEPTVVSAQLLPEAF